MSKKVLIKIDAVGSKEWCSKGMDTQSRRELLLNQLKETIINVYEKADLPYPEGEYISAQGDCINLCVDDPEYAVLKTIEFQREWFDYNDEFPDCRAIIDYSDVRDFNNTPNHELLSEGFENISVIEKAVSKGEIYITEAVLQELDSEIVKTIKLPPVIIANSRRVNIYKIEYDDPRLIEENYLVQTIFFADTKSDTIRDKVIGSKIIEIVFLHDGKKIAFSSLIEELKEKKIDVSEDHLKNIVNNNYVLSLEDNLVTIKKEKEIELENLKNNFNEEKEYALDFIAKNLSDSIGIFTAEEFREIVDFEGLLQEYLFAVFGDIKNVVSYYNCEKQKDFYDRLLNPNYFDSILKDKLRHIQNLDEENRILFKKELLRALSLLTKNESKYISNIFHNILINYYLNRNERYLAKQLENLKKKIFYLDTNTYYSYKISASQYNKKALYIFDKLKALSCNLKMFNITIHEYNEALNRSRAIYKVNPYTATKGNAVPWIIHEFIKHSGNYGNRIDACVDAYLIDATNNIAFTKKEKIKVEKLDPLLERKDLDDLCNKIASIKRSKLDQSTFEEKMLHDANCLNFLKASEKGFSAQKIFITCDFALAKIRKISDYGNSIVTINELYDFLLPYLLITDDSFSNPNRLPNMLLETAIDLELGDSIDLEQIVGDYLINKSDKLRYKNLNSSMMTKRFEEIEKKNKAIQEENLSDDECTIQMNEEYMNLQSSYIETVKKSTIECLYEHKNKIIEQKLVDKEKELSDHRKELSEKDAKIAELELKLKKNEQKEKRREKYEKKTKGKISKSKQKKKKRRR